jgi:hypothetical protein
MEEKRAEQIPLATKLRMTYLEDHFRRNIGSSKFETRRGLELKLLKNS